VLRVVVPGSVVAPSVVLYARDGSWECDCGSSEDVCAHVAAAVISVRRASREGRALPESGRGRGHVRYAFTRDGGGLAFERFVVCGDEVVRLAGTLTALASGRIQGPPVAASAADLEAERTLGAQRSGRLPRGVLRSLLRILADAPDVRLDGEPVRAAAEPALPCAALEDDGPGFRISLERDPPVSEWLGDDVVRCGDELRELAPTGLEGHELDALRRGWRFGADDATRLVTEVLPSLERRVRVDVRTRRLPRARSVPPRILLRTEREGDDLAVLPTLVYGDPPLARVDAGRLVPLRGEVPVRDEAAESRLASDLRARLGLAPGHRIVLAGDEAIAFAARLAAWPGEVEGRAHQAFFRGPALLPRLVIDEERFDVAFAAEDAPAAVGAGRVLRAWREGRSLVPLDAGGFAPLPAGWLERLGPRVATLLAARDAKGRLPRFALPELARLCDEVGAARPAVLGRLAALVDGFAGLPEPVLPADLTGSLRSYQREGVRWLAFLRDAGLGALLADDMGLGKTLQALAVLRGRSLVVCPTSVLPGWSEEIARFRPALRVCVHHGPRRRLDPDADLVLTSWAILRLDRDLLAAERFDAVVIDEAQAIKNPDSQLAQAAFALQAGFRLALTGTPVENRLEELWSQLHFANPGLLGTRRDFEEQLARPIAAGDEDAVRRLRERIRPFVLRRRKADVAPELPPRQELIVHCSLGEAERALYESVRAATVPEVVARLREGGGVLAALEALLRLRQACCHPRLLPGAVLRSDPAESGDERRTNSAKLDALLERLETAVADGHKALVFSQWTSLLDLVEPRLHEAALPFTRLDGSTRDRAGVLQTFAAADGPPVLLLSLKAGGTGLNLTTADHVFLLDPWWNPAAEDQAADRAHRIGQERPVLVHRLVAEDTVEERILALQARKRALAEAALGEGGAAASLTRDDLLALLA
jgi:superfamily II DNA or RNA helicase